MSSLVVKKQPCGPALAAAAGLVTALSGTVAMAVAGGGQMLRALLLGGALWALALPLLGSLEAGLLAMMFFEPLRGFLRRAQFIFVEFTTTDPIHLVTPLLTLLALTILLWRRRGRLFGEMPLARPVTALALVFIVQIFNPFQGGLFVGLSGAMFILIPVAWFYFGQWIRPEMLGAAMRLVVIMGLVCSPHGLYQLLIGYPSFEQYWIAHTDHYESIAVGHVTRALATFNSAEEWGRYVQYGAVMAAGLSFGARTWARRGGWGLACALLIGVLLITGQRTGIFGLLLALLTLLLLGARGWRQAAGRLGLLLAAGLLLVLAVKAPSSDEMWRMDGDAKVETMLSHTARGTLQPAREESLLARLMIWNRLLSRILPARPFGTGLGAGTVAAARYANPEDELYPIDSFVAVLLVGCSLPAALLFLWILGRGIWLALCLYKRSAPGTDAAMIRRIAAAILPMLLLNSFFGLTFSIYSAAPIAWLLLGWVGAETARAETQGRAD
ncbi:MAG: O-antigen ligase family protein [Blastocatellia bacterium]